MSTTALTAARTTGPVPRVEAVSAMISTLLVLLVVALAGWAVTFVLRPARPAIPPPDDWEHGLRAHRLRPVLARMQAATDLAAAAGAAPEAIERAAVGKARDGAPLVVVRLVDGRVLVGARRTGPVPADHATTATVGWQLAVGTETLADAWQRAAWVHTGPPVHR
jgi:hypothetical protein